ncbi:lysophospholipid acyltransferase LPCAT4 [Labeo rohita]|uniref:Lysophospholipid acyltransferase LPCAT4 n=1 Tax=Labeo rohita TaxID=84645 RepID=A0A498NWN2_LABRO|nr:lysophospholipid acyltransferase LPCAT4 [Labeo rohita]
MGIVLFPVRITLATLFFLLMWPIARLRLAGLSEAERAEPVRGWRWWLFHHIMVFLSRAVFFSVGFLWIKVKGRQAGLKEAPVLVVAPHSSFLDMLVLCTTGLPVVVSRSENCKLPVIGALLEFNQSVLVSRKDPESRKKCVSQISERVTSDGHWPQMLMFPEGTTTNGRALIKFKPGAFLAGVPVQPVLLHYPSEPDTVRWTWKGLTWLGALWHTTSQIYTSVTVEFLPVYTPSQKEKQNPDLYAENVQKLMAKALRVPATDYVMEGRFPVKKLGNLSLPLEPPAQETLKLLREHRCVCVCVCVCVCLVSLYLLVSHSFICSLTNAHVEAVMNHMIDTCHSGQSTMVTADHLTALLGLKDKKTAVKICSLYSKWYDTDQDGLLSADDLSGLMGALVGVPQYGIADMYTALTTRGRPTEASLQDLLLTHPVYRKVFTEYLNSVGLADGNHNGVPNGKANGNNNGIYNGYEATSRKSD